jgi:transposase
MLQLTQYKKIIALHNQGHSIRNIKKRTGHARKTIRRVIRVKVPPPPKAYSRPHIIDDYKDTVKEYCGIGSFTVQQIYDEIKINGYDGSYLTVYRYVCSLAEQNKRTLRKNRPTNGNRKEKEVAWVLSLLQGKISINELEELFEKQLDIKSINTLYKYMLENSLRYRNRAVTIFSYSNKLSKKSISEIVGIDRHTVRDYIKQFESGGTSELFDFSRKETKKYEAAEYKDKVFQILHSPPSYFKFNRTAWRLEDLYQTMKTEGFPLSKANITKIIKNAGYKFIKAKKVLTSNDPLYREKLQEITTILSNLKPNEKFFSIDEFGPLAIKIRGGRSWTPPEDHKIFSQWQQSKGSLIVTAALELSTNQITHFYSAKKNTTEMIALLDILLKQY